MLPFPRLPLLCQLLIIQKVEFLDLLKLSTCSQKINTLIQHAKISLLKLAVVLEESRVILMFMFPGSQCRFHIGIDMNPEEKSGEWVRYRHREVGSDWCSLDVPSEKQEFLANVEKMVDFLMTLFGKTELYTLEFKPSKTSRKLVRKVVKKHWKTTEYLAVEDYGDSEDSERALTDKEVNWALKVLSVTKNIYFTSKVLPGVQYTKGFNSKVVTIENPSWIHVDSIINSITENFYFTGANPSNSVLNTILKAWISGGKLLNLKLLSWESDWVKGGFYPEDFEDEVMEEIEEATLTLEEKIRNPFEDEEEEEDGRYVRRCDGKLAVVMMNSTIFQIRVC